MVSFSQLREFAEKQAREDKQNKAVDVQGPSLEDALKKASIELGLPLKRLEYEVLEQGSRGFAGMGAKPWKLHVYEKAKEVKVAGVGAEEDLLASLAAVQPEREKDLPGGVQVRITPEGAFLKVTKPKGRGARVSEIMALEKLSLRSVSGFDPSLVARVVKHADGEFIRIGDADSRPEHVLVGAFTLALLTQHGALFLAWKTEGVLHARARRVASAVGVLTLGLLPAVTWASARVQPLLFAPLDRLPVAEALAAFAAGGIGAVIAGQLLGRARLAFLGSCATIAGLLGATAALRYPVLLASTVDPALSIVAQRAAAGPHGLAIGLRWWPLGLLLVVGYFSYLFHTFRGKVSVESDHG